MIPKRTRPVPLGLIQTFIIFLLVLHGTARADSERDFEFDDIDVIIKKRSADNTLGDDEDLVNDEPGSGDVEGSGIDVAPTVDYPGEFFRVTINFTDLQFTQELRDQNSKSYSDLTSQITVALENLFRNVQGQQRVIIVEYNPGSLMVTFDLETDGFYNRSVLYETINRALNAGVIAPYRVSPAGFDFTPLRDGMACPFFVGRDPSRLPRIGDNRANLLTNMMFPCRGYVVAWQYYRIIPRYTGYVGVWRQTDQYKFILIGKTALPPAPVGNTTVFAEFPILVEDGDFIGIFYPRDAEEGVVASATDTSGGVDVSRELYQNYYSRFYNDQVNVGTEFDLETVTFEEARATFAIKAVMDYTTVGLPQPSGCRDDQFQCGDKQCIDARLKCDGQDDCFDSSDEKNCTPVKCLPDEFRCSNNRQCVPQTFRCNLQPDCIDGSDEEGCPFTACTIQEFRCNDGTCIKNELLCDKQPDCPDKSDEIGCPTTCKVGEFQCDDGNCINENLKCDGYPDCADRSDETPNNCVTDIQCPEGLYRCENGQCISPNVECDGKVDCADGSDEIPAKCGVPATTLRPCTTTEFRCDNGQCIPDDLRCDTLPDCDDRSDESETNCPGGCAPGLFKCKNGSCIDRRLVCDGFPDCIDYSDEEPCTIEKDCPENQHRCRDGQCTKSDALCDGVVDCQDSSDESPQICGPIVTLSISKSQLILNEGENAVFDCSATGNVAVSVSWRKGSGNLPAKAVVQNGRLIIPNITMADVDDYICFTTTVQGINEVKGDLLVIPACKDGQFRCSDGSCIQNDFWCDGFPDCGDKSDEDGCGNFSICPEGQYKCDDGSCTNGAKCDGRVDCGDGSDEFPQVCGCSPGQFMCKNGRLCIQGDFECNQNYDCPDRSDEHANCTVTCSTNEFTCGNGQCIDSRRTCDGYPDCSDTSDEADALCSTCRLGDFRCRINFQCIDARLACDGYPDCLDRTDEANCSCKSNEFRCGNGQCIDNRRRCDRVKDCFDNSDEVGCPCRSDEFTCGDGTCIPQSQICDRRPDCQDRSDEAICPCQSNEFTCGDGTCIPQSQRCDRRPDCRDRSDEANCPCQSNEFTCGDGTCIPQSQRCDRRPDCRDRSDEANCPCQSNEFTCGDGSCIPQSQRCDRRPDCRDRSDEVNCPCQSNEFTCGDGRCIQESRKCDRRADCADRSDEANCPCRPDEFTCGDGTCIPESRKCDRRADCADRSDENDCDCSANEFSCNSGQCVPLARRCDQRSDCNDGSDELNCPRPIIVSVAPPALTLREGRQAQFQCSSTRPGVVLRWTRKGDTRGLPLKSSVENNILTIPEVREEDSGDYLCEAVGVVGDYSAIARLQVQSVRPPTTPPPQGICRPGESVCQNQECIPSDYRCDGDVDCSDGSDETSCDPVSSCEPNEFRCNNGLCAMKIWRCDKDDDCGDNSDEQNCPQRKPGDPCSPDEYQCTSGNQCVPASYQCDEEIDCLDRSDEIGCAPPSINVAPPPKIEVELGGIFTIICEAVGTPTPLIVWRLNWGNIPSGDRVYTSSINGRGNLTITDARIEDSGAYTCEAINVKGSIFASPDAIVIVRRTPQGLCNPPFFNVEAAISSQCIRCFCFGHTDQCYSSDLQISRISLVGEMKMVDINTTQPINTRYVELLTSGSYQNFYQVGDGLRLIPPGVYYWSLPREFLGDRLTSYGGSLQYEIFYTLGRQVSQIVDQADIIMSGNGITLYHRSSTVVSPGGRVTVTAPLLPNAWTSSEGPQRGDTPVLEYATREQLMMVLENLDHIYIRSQYDTSQSVTRVGNIILSTGVRENTGLGRTVFVEDCQCPPGYSGLSCQECAPGYRRVKQGQYLGICTRCNCYGHSSDCDPVTGQCRFCSHNTEGSQCERCKPGFYGDATQGTTNACKPCPCPLTSAPNQFSPTCKLDTDGQPTCTACQTGYVGRRCDQCDTGYIGDPSSPGNYCRPFTVKDKCDTRGSLRRSPDPVTGRCACKANVQGDTCDQCKDNTFHLSLDNPYGCIKCFCMGVTDRCFSTTRNRARVGASFTRDRRGFNLTDILQRETISDGFIIDSNVLELVYRNFNNLQPDKVYYWSLPQPFLGDKVVSYGGNLRFVLTYRPGLDSSPQELNAPLVQLIGNDITLMYQVDQSPVPNTPVPYTIPIYESAWSRLDGRPASREFLLMALADLEAILIRATFTKDTDQASIREVTLDTAEDRNTGQDRAYAVEQCQCPRGYKGLSCEDCDVGYRRTTKGLYLRICEPCQCNGHSGECDPETGRCRNCQHNTVGDKCERCAAGYYGDAKRGTPSDCQLCPCPLTQAPNQFSPTCILDTDGQVTCTACPAGHTGRRCERCVQGYTGNPLRPGDYCKIDTGPKCDCDLKGTVPNTQCNQGTKQCQCKAHVQGLRCQYCREGYFGLSESNPQGCLSCYCSGVTKKCSSSNYFRDRIRPNLNDDDTHNFVLTNRRLSKVVSDGFTLDTVKNEIAFDQFSGIQRERESLYFNLPPKFRGNRVTSYGGKLSFTIEYEALIGSGNSFRDADVEIVTTGQRQRIYYLFNPSLRENQPEDYEIQLVESSFQMLDGSTPTREIFMNILSDIEAIIIRASFHSTMSRTSLRNLYMDTAVATPTTYGPAPMVENCQCPEGYTGLSCEQCAAGYVRQDGTSGPGRCVSCRCNGHASSCNPLTGQCLNCQHNTVGDRCERCAEGYYGDATAGTSTDCRRCPCPLTVSSNQFSPTCYLDTDRQVTCDRCPTGYLGRNCGTCDTERGYVGNPGPREIGGSCTLEREKLKPTITVNPVSIDESVGNTVVFQCDVRGTRPFNVVWSRSNGQPLPTRAQVGPRYSLTIRDLVETDSGRYVCTATNIHGSTREYVRLTVTGREMPIRVYVENPKDVTVDEGTSVRFVCVATGSLTKMTFILSWTRQDSNLPNKAIDQNGVLVIPNVQPEDAGNYICTGSDMISTDTDVATLTVSPTQTPPQVRIEPRYQTVKEGEAVEFKCIASGRPPPVVEWRKGGGQMNPDATTDNGVLRIPYARRSDESEYFCKATNVAGTSDIRTILYVQRGTKPPDVTVIIRETAVIVIEGSTARLYCYVDDRNLRATLVWSRTNGLPIGSSQEGGVLSIPNVQQSFSGTYICTAITPTGDRGTATATVTVKPSSEQAERPVATITPQRVTIAQGTTGTITCEVTGRPTPTIRWSKSQADLTSRHQVSGNILRIVNAMVEDRGLYLCEAENSAGKSSPAWVIVEVERRQKPKIELYPKDAQTINVGGSALFQCRVMGGDPPPTVLWKRAGGEALTSTTEIMANGVIMFKNVQGEEQGSYICTATNGMGSITASATLIVQGPPRIIIQPSKTIYAVVGQRISVECIAEGEPTPQVYWRYETPPARGDIPAFDAIEAERRATAGSSTLTIESVSVADSGNFVCVATNNAGKVTENVQLIVQDDNTANTGVAIKGPGTVSAVEGQSVTLECETQGLTNPTVRWRKRSGQLPPNHSIRGGTLFIPRFRKEYAGEYICSAVAGQNNYEASVFIIVTVTPTLTISPARVEARAGETVQLRCQPQGQGPFTIDWVKMGGSLSPTAVQRDDGLLEIRQVTAADAGRYRCVATNLAGSSDGIAIVDVQVPPTIVAPLRETRPQAGRTIELECKASGSPQPTITWEKQGGTLPPNSDIRGGLLTIYNIRREDEGRYICTASSNAGVARDFVMVFVQAVDGGGGTIRVDTQTVNVGERVEMECVASGAPQPTVKWSRLDVPLPVGSTVNDVFLVIPQVKEEDTGTYVCTVENVVGSIEQRVNLYVRARPSITGGSQSLTAALGSTAAMRCEAVGYPKPDITWFKKQGSMPRDYSVEDGMLKIDQVRPEDAGTYLCNAQNDIGKVEQATELVVGDMVPYFAQNPVSYISYPPLNDVYMNFDILLSLKPETTDGIVLYNGQYDDATGDYVCFGMREGYPEFRFDVGSGPAVIRGNETLDLNEWHTVKLTRDRTQGNMIIDDQASFSGQSPGRFQGLDLSKNMYLGGVPDFSKIPEPARYSSGFVGSISQVKVKGVEMNLGAEALEMVGVVSYNACKDKPCLNRGRCIPANNVLGYSCMCIPGYTGTRCEITGLKCYPGACGPDGRCHDMASGYHCICPMGRIGAGCQNTLQVVNPQFNVSSFASYSPIQRARFQMKIEMEFKPQSLNNGIILYSGQNENGTGDYIAILIRDQYLEFRYNTGSGPAILRSRKPLVANVWTRIEASKSGQEGTLIVNDDQPVKVWPWSYYSNIRNNYYNYYLRRRYRYRYKRATSPGTTIGLDLKTMLYIGGTDPSKKIPSDIDITDGFVGCIAEVTINALKIGLVRNALETLNVRDCGEKDICNRKPCKNNGVCQNVSAKEYRCICPKSHTGTNCEIKINICTEQRPCKNNGVCSITSTGYRCDCPLGYMGDHCQASVQLGDSIEVNRNGYVEFSKDLFPLSPGKTEEVISLSVKTTSPNGLLLWKGESAPDQSLQSGDFLSIGLQDGYVVFRYELGTGPANIRSRQRVNDGYSHTITTKRLGRQGTLIIDNKLTDAVSGTSKGILQMLNAPGNVYIGGVPSVTTMTSNRYNDNYSGCISNIKLQGKGPLRIPEDAAGGYNVRPCMNKK